MFFDDRKKVSLGGKRGSDSKDQKDFVAAKRR